MHWFLHGDLEEDVYMEIPQALVSQVEPTMLIKEGLIWTKASLLAWFVIFTKAMVCLGYKQSQGDHTLPFKHSQGEKLTVLLVYVDDIIVTGHDLTETQLLNKELAKKFGNCGDLDIFISENV
jgi:heme/copper-type cytochrome/quinol oxidase subunit 2